LVVAVEDDSDAADKGVLRGDVIDEIQQQSTLNGADAKAAIAKAQQDKRASVLLRVISGKKVGFIGVKLAKR
jgi:S1-C subfamily serine protease